jgi:hypothetical protein
MRSEMKIGEERVVDLDVAAPGGFEIGDLGAVRAHDVGEEGLDVGIDVGGDDAAAAVKVQARWRGDRDLRRALRRAGEKGEVAHEDRFGPPERGDGDHVLRYVVHRAAGIVREGRVLFRCAYLDAAEPADEVGVPVLAPELAVGDDLEPDPLLARHDGADRGVFDGSQASRVDLAACVRLAGGEDFRRPQETPDVVGPKKRLGTGGGGAHRAAPFAGYGRTGLLRAQRFRPCASCRHRLQSGRRAVSRWRF